LVQAEKDYILRKFLDSYYESLKKFAETNGVEADEQQKKTIVTSLLSDSNLDSYIDSAKNYYQQWTSNLELDFQKKQQKGSFWKDMGINILANVFYSIILIVLFWVAKDQITSWLTQLMK
jgi:hypothetical protein